MIVQHVLKLGPPEHSDVLRSSKSQQSILPCLLNKLV